MLMNGSAERLQRLSGRIRLERAMLVCLVMLVSAAFQPLTAEKLEFRNVGYVELTTQDNGHRDEKEWAARLQIDRNAQELRIVDAEKDAFSAVYVQISFPDITRILYERTKPSLSKKHWLTVEWAGMSGDGYAYVRLDKSNQRQIRAALNAFGFKVEVLTDD